MMRVVSVQTLGVKANLVADMHVESLAVNPKVGVFLHQEDSDESVQRNQITYVDFHVLFDVLALEDT